MSKPPTPAVPGWFTLDPQAPHLLGQHCATCGAYFFPRRATPCARPDCSLEGAEPVELSRRGRLWSYTNNCYPPPPPYVSAEPFEPYAIAAVELEREKMVVLGQVVSGVGVEELEVGMEMELVLETLYEDDEHDVQVWKWRPVPA